MKTKPQKQNWMKTVFAFAAQCKSKMVLSVLCAVVGVVGGFIPYLGVYQIIISFFTGIPAMQTVFYWVGICVIGYVVKLLFYGISTILSHVSAYTVLENMRLKMADKLMKAPLGVVLSDTAGRLKNVMVDRVASIELPLAHMIPEGISNFLLPIGVFIYMICIDWRMALSMLATLPFALAGFVFMMRGFNRQYDKYMSTSNHVNSVTVEYVEGIEIIKAFNQSSTSYEKFADAVYSFKASTMEWYRATWLSKNFCMAVLPSTLLCTLPLGMYLYAKGALTPAEMSVCLILSLGIVPPLISFANLLNDVKTIEYAVKEAKAFLDMPELESVSAPVGLDDCRVVLSRVSFSYTGKEERNALTDISLSIPSGKVAALVGPSGGGKSTIARLIARFWDVSSGVISIGGVDIRKIPVSQLMDTVSFVTQDNFLFNCSLKENIRLGNPAAKDAEVFAAAKAAMCDEFIGKLERGYETTVGEAGGKLSGGEKQRIAIARAILKNSPVVILDEATAFTDPQNEDKIQRSISALTKGKTLIVIAHRLSTIKNADMIVVLEKGKIVQTGTQNELLENCPLYQEMWSAHVGAKHWVANAAIRKEAQ